MKAASPNMVFLSVKLDLGTVKAMDWLVGQVNLGKRGRHVYSRSQVIRGVLTRFAEYVRENPALRGSIRESIAEIEQRLAPRGQPQS